MDWKTGPHKLTYRQTERTFGLAGAALAKDQPSGALQLRARATACREQPVSRRAHFANSRAISRRTV